MRPTAEEDGYLHCGPSGAGHFVKMVHNGIEYGLMASYAEGLNLLAPRERRACRSAPHDAETAPLFAPGVVRLRPRRGRNFGAVEEGQRRRVVAPRPHRRRASRIAPELDGARRVACPTPGRAAGRRSPRSSQVLRRPCSRQPSTPASPREARTTSRIACSRRCESSSAATPRSRTERRQRRTSSLGGRAVRARHAGERQRQLELGEQAAQDVPTPASPPSARP